MRAEGENQDNLKDPPGHRVFAIIAACFVASLIISNIAAIKLIPVGPFIFTAGVFLFPVTYIFGDILTEVYGYAKARRVIWIGLFSNLFMAVFLWFVVLLPPASIWPLQEEFSLIFKMVPRLVLASIVAYWAGEFINSYVLARMKIVTKGKKLWMRTIGSTVAGQGIDTIIFVSIAWIGVLPWNILLIKGLSGYGAKVLYEVVATPWTCWIIKHLKRIEGQDVYDMSTKFSPFRWKL